MRKILKCNRGFTLVEMVIVIAIILLFSVVFFFSVSAYLNKAKSARNSISTHNEAVSKVTSEVDVALNN